MRYVSGNSWRDDLKKNKDMRRDVVDGRKWDLETYIVLDEPCSSPALSENAIYEMSRAQRRSYRGRHCSLSPKTPLSPMPRYASCFCKSHGCGGSRVTYNTQRTHKREDIEQVCVD